MNGLAVQRASGSIHAAHFELNCNGTEGSADLLLDASCNGLAVVGTEHFTVQGPQYGVRAKAVGNMIVGVVMSTSRLFLAYSFATACASGASPSVLCSAPMNG